MWFVILTLAIYRTTRLWLYDVIAEPIRSRVIGGDLLTCQWCLGVWVSFGAVAVLALGGMQPYDASVLGVALAVATALALAAAQSALHLVEDLLLLAGDDD